MEGDTEVDLHNLDGNEDVYVTWFWRVADNLVVDETEIAVTRNSFRQKPSIGSLFGRDSDALAVDVYINHMESHSETKQTFLVCPHSDALAVRS